MASIPSIFHVELQDDDFALDDEEFVQVVSQMDAKMNNNHRTKARDSPSRSERKTLTDVENIAEKSFKRKEQLLPSPPTSKKVTLSTSDTVNGASQFDGVIDLNDSLLLFDGDDMDNLETCDVNNVSSPSPVQNFVNQNERAFSNKVVQLSKRADSSFKTDNWQGGNSITNLKANQCNPSKVGSVSNIDTNNNATDGNCLTNVAKTQQCISITTKVTNSYKTNTNTTTKETELSRDNSSYNEIQKENISKWKKSSQNKKHYNSLVTRRFPGPAGILPRLRPGQRVEDAIAAVCGSDTATFIKENARWQAELITKCNEIEQEFPTEMWEKLINSLQNNRNCANYCNFNINTIIEMAKRKQLPNNRIPGLLTILKSLTPTNSGATAVFSDPTGEIVGALHQKVLEENSKVLVQGAGVILQKVSLLSPSSKQHFLNIVPGNISTIYSPTSLVSDDDSISINKSTVSNSCYPRSCTLANETPSNTAKHKHSITDEKTDEECEYSSKSPSQIPKFCHLNSEEDVDTLLNEFLEDDLTEELGLH